MDQNLPDRARQGRGAVSNRSSRYDAETKVSFDDGWGSADLAADELPPLRTTVSADGTRTIIARNDSPDIGSTARSTRTGAASMAASPGRDLETKLTAKFDGPALLERELRAKNYQCAGWQWGPTPILFHCCHSVGFEGSHFSVAAGRMR